MGLQKALQGVERRKRLEKIGHNRAEFYFQAYEIQKQQSACCAAGYEYAQGFDLRTA